MPEATEKLAVVSLAAGILGFFFPVVGPVTAIVSGHVARDEIKKSRGRLGGDAMARTGLILGYIWIGLMVAAVGLGFAYFSARQGSSTRDEGSAITGPHVDEGVEVLRLDAIPPLEGLREFSEGSGAGVPGQVIIGPDHRGEGTEVIVPPGFGSGAAGGRSIRIAPGDLPQVPEAPEAPERPEAPGRTSGF
ncbi:DUF4190 domain-containing protein [Tautonia sociabilis]|uniref:DUF4190 domain-containing protein n=2 Tax=Tautonia sociabilis TaxID=2080755 RepID=A0A432ME58_9BACT|nr:DUF4190 domain-containing protein [Tautonia sociabilis]